MASRHAFCVNLPVELMALASVALQLLTGFSTHKIYRKFLIIIFFSYGLPTNRTYSFPGWAVKGKLLKPVFLLGFPLQLSLRSTLVLWKQMPRVL